MKKSDKIELFAAENRKGVVMNKMQYEQIVSLIIDSIDRRPDRSILFYDLLDEARVQLGSSFPGDLVWFVLQVKVDLQEREIIRTTHDRMRRQYIEIHPRGRNKLLIIQ